MSVRQVWKCKPSTPKSSPPSQNDSPPPPSRVYLQSPSPPSYNPLRDQMINQLHNISTILDSHTNPSNAYIHAPPSPPPPQIHPPSHAQILTPRDITLEGFNLQNKVVDFVSNGVWSWPQSWLLKAPNLEQIMVFTLDTSSPDLPHWCDLNGKMSNFAVSCAWEALRPRGVEVWNLVRPLAGMDLVQPRMHDHIFFECYTYCFRD
ncbi:hypothetical protein Tco_0575978 [Tanacetum coccineum]